MQIACQPLQILCDPLRFPIRFAVRRRCAQSEFDVSDILDLGRNSVTDPISPSLASFAAATEHSMTMLATPAETIDFLSVLRDRDPLTKTDLADLMGKAVGAGANTFRTAAQELIEQAEAGETHLIARAGVAAYYLGQPMRAINLLETAENDGLGQYYLGHALSSVERHEEAAEVFERASKLGFEPVESILLKAGEIRAAGNVDEAEALIRSTKGDGARLAEYSFQMGQIMSDRGDAPGAIEYFERAVDMDPHHSKALFSLAIQNSIHGNDDEAVKLYERALAKPPYYVGAMLNLGLLYEDAENYGAARYCFEKVLGFDPLNERAALYLKDIEATADMYYDEETLRQQARLEQLLNRPVTDFELSVRSRNCLATMGIKSLGDLTRISEQELLAGKNFGETSLVEIRELMVAHRLDVGQNLHEKHEETQSFSMQDLSPQEQQELSRPVSDLNLSVRARKCMNRLGIVTIGELLSRTPDELLSAKNFGVTSLNEVRLKLGEMELKLRND